MRVSVQTKILMTVLTVVLMFAFFILFYFPSVQEKSLLRNYHKEVQNLANTVALGVEIALTEQNFDGVQTAMDYVIHDTRLKHVSILQKGESNQSIQPHTLSVFRTYPDSVQIDVNTESDDSTVIKRASFDSPVMNGEVLLGFTTSEIIRSKRQIRLTSLIVSSIVFLIGIVIGFWLARNISVPVLALRDAANRVGEGDLSQRVKSRTRDEIGELGTAFNRMVDDLDSARRERDQRTNELIVEKRKADDLLLNILPAETAEELKATGTAKAKSYASVTVMFVDIKDFTGKTESMNPEKLVAELNYCFTAFDRIVQDLDIEKIKTIGDAYMCVAGLPREVDNHAQLIALAAFEIRDFMNTYNQRKYERNEIPFEIRIGINTGPVVAGIVGLNKFAYDIWGNTVNIASRMESSSEPGRINISRSTYDILKDEFDCVLRGKVETKGIGEIEMYFLEPLTRPLSA